MVIKVKTSQKLHLSSIIDTTLMENLIEGMIVYNIDGEIIYWNKAAERITGTDFSQHKERKCRFSKFCHRSLNGVPLCDTSCPNKIAIQKDAIIEETLYYTDEEDSSTPILLNVIPVKDQNNKPIGTVQLFSIDHSKDNIDKIYNRLKGKMDEYSEYIKELVQKNKALNKKLVSLSYTDTLTSLYNRRYFYTEAQKALNKALENNTPITILVMDIDFFKKINDIHGHLAGDEALKVVSSLIKKNSGEDALVCRFGGEEFLVLIQDIQPQQALEIAEKIRQSIANASFVYENTPIPLSISIGVYCQIPSKTTMLQHMTDFADQALYKAKQTGRNKSVVYQAD